MSRLAALSFAVLASMVIVASDVRALAHWEGDAIDEKKNNPPDKNADLPAGLRKTVVRVGHNYQTGEGKQRKTHSAFGWGPTFSCGARATISTGRSSAFEPRSIPGRTRTCRASSSPALRARCSSSSAGRN